VLEGPLSLSTIFHSLLPAPAACRVVSPEDCCPSFTGACNQLGCVDLLEVQTQQSLTEQLQGRGGERGWSRGQQDGNRGRVGCCVCRREYLVLRVVLAMYMGVG